MLYLFTAIFLPLFQHRKLHQHETGFTVRTNCLLDQKKQAGGGHVCVFGGLFPQMKAAPVLHCCFCLLCSISLCFQVNTKRGRHSKMGAILVPGLLWDRGKKLFHQDLQAPSQNVISSILKASCYSLIKRIQILNVNK